MLDKPIIYLSIEVYINYWLKNSSNYRVIAKIVNMKFLLHPPKYSENYSTYVIYFLDLGNFIVSKINYECILSTKFDWTVTYRER